MPRTHSRLPTARATMAAVLAAGMLAIGTAPAARAQTAVSPAQPAGQPGWSFNLAPYVWMPWLNVNLGYNLPNGLGGKLPTSLTVGPGEIYNNLRIGGTFAADARYGRFSILTDVLYL